jgi:hypothetical protein
MGKFTNIFTATALFCIILFTFVTFRVLPPEKLGAYRVKFETPVVKNFTIRAIVKKDYHVPMGDTGTILLVVDFHKGEMVEYARYPREVITAAAADKSWETLIVAGFRLGKAGEFVRAVALRDDGPKTHNLIELTPEYGSRYSIVFDKDRGVFYIGRAYFAGQSRSMIDSYFLHGETGETPIYKYDPARKSLDQVIALDSYLVFSGASSEDKLGVAYFSYPVSKSFGYIEKDSGLITGTWFLPPVYFPIRDLPSSLGREGENHPVCYYVIPGNDSSFYPERGVVYVGYLNAADDAKTQKLGDDVFTPVLYSDKSQALVFLERLDRAGETIKITAEFLESESKYSFELPPLRSGEYYKLLFVE